MTSALKMYGVDLLKFWFGFSSVFKKKTQTQFRMSLVWFGLKKCDLV